MKWLRFRHQGRTGFGVLEGGQDAVHAGDMFGESGATGERVPLADLEWLTPSVPGKMIRLWNNFHAAAEKNGWATPAEPLYFLKAASSLCAHGQPIHAPASYDGRVIYEGELAVVIGRTAAGGSVEEAPSCIFGYSCANGPARRSPGRMLSSRSNRRIRPISGRSQPRSGSRTTTSCSTARRLPTSASAPTTPSPASRWTDELTSKYGDLRRSEQKMWIAFDSPCSGARSRLPEGTPGADKRGTEDEEKNP